MFYSKYFWMLYSKYFVSLLLMSAAPEPIQSLMSHSDLFNISHWQVATAKFTSYKSSVSCKLWQFDSLTVSREFVVGHTMHLSLMLGQDCKLITTPWKIMNNVSCEHSLAGTMPSKSAVMVPRSDKKFACCYHFADEWGRFVWLEGPEMSGPGVARSFFKTFHSHGP